MTATGKEEAKKSVAKEVAISGTASFLVATVQAVAAPLAETIPILNLIPAVIPAVVAKATVTATATTAIKPLITRWLDDLSVQKTKYRPSGIFLDYVHEPSAVPLVERLRKADKPEDIASILHGMERSYQNANLLFENMALLDDEDKVLDLCGRLFAGAGWGSYLGEAGVIGPVLARKAERLKDSKAFEAVLSSLPAYIAHAPTKTLGSLEPFTYITLWQDRHAHACADYVTRLISDDHFRRAETRQRLAYYGNSRELFISVQRHNREREEHLHTHDLGAVLEMQECWRGDPFLSGPLRKVNAEMIAAVKLLKLSENVAEALHRALDYQD